MERDLIYTRYCLEGHLAIETDDLNSSSLHWGEMETIMKSNNNYNRIPESKKILRVESRFLGFGIQNSAQGVRNPSVTIEIRNSRIQDCLVLPYMEQFLMHDNSKKSLKFKKKIDVDW